MKKTLKLIMNIVTWVVLVITIVMLALTVFSSSVLGKNNRHVFGYKAFIVRSDSMKSVNGDESKGYFESGDLIFVKNVNPETLEAGDIISYISVNPYNYGETITHMIKGKTTNEKGEVGFITYGTSSGAVDTEVVTYPYVLGKFERKISNIGNFFAFLKTPAGYMVCIFLPFSVLIVVQAISSIKLYVKQKQLEAVEASKKKTDDKAQAEK